MKLFIPIAVGILLYSGCSKPATTTSSPDQSKIAELQKQLDVLKAQSSPTPDLKHPNKEIFRPLLDAYLSRSPRSLEDEDFALPRTWEAGQFPRTLNALVSAGLIRATRATYEKKYYHLGGDLANIERVPGTHFELTEEGRKFYSSGTTRTRYSISQQEVPTGIFTYGKYRVRDILSYTEPAAGLGATVTEVRFTYDCGPDLAVWARNPAIMQAFESVRNDAQHYFEDRKSFVLTSEGWELADH